MSKEIKHILGAAGGYLVGNPHSKGGIKAINKAVGKPLEMEGGEVVITKPAVEDNELREFEGEMLTNRQILSKINESGGGVSFAEKGAELPTEMHCSGKSYKYGGENLTDYEITHRISKCGCEHDNAYKIGGELEKDLKKGNIISNQTDDYQNIVEEGDDLLIPGDLDAENLMSADMDGGNAMFKKGGLLSDSDKQTLYNEWNDLVNMSSLELQNYYDSKDGETSGLSASETKEQGIKSGRESARWIIKMKETPINDWTAEMWEWAKRQISFIKRMSGVEGDLYDENNQKTRKHKALLIWGHNPEKYAKGGETSDNEFNYMMLSRLKTDNDYFLGNGNRNPKHLWATNVEEQIAEMKRLWNILPVKPEWLSMDDILNYEKQMTDSNKNTNKNISISISDYKNPYEVNRAIEALLDSKENGFTPNEIEFISNYSGYGGLEKQGSFSDEELKGLLYEYFTPDAVVKKMWALAYKYGFGTFSNPHIMEPSVGTGNFFKYAPTDAELFGNEINNYSKRVCEILYPKAMITLQPFEKNFISKNNSIKNKLNDIHKYHLVIGNPPYGRAVSKYLAMGESDYTKATSFTEYFITRGLDLLHPGGLLIFVVGAEQYNGGTLFLDSGISVVKKNIFDKAQLIDAYRLPTKIFERTGVASEILVFKKK